MTEPDERTTRDTGTDSRSDSGSDPLPPLQEQASPGADDGQQFHGWRLLGVIGVVVVGIAAVSALLDVLLRPQ